MQLECQMADMDILGKEVRGIHEHEIGYNKNNELQYRGRLAELKNLEFVNSKNDLLEAMQCISQTNKGPLSQYPSAGCSIKWKSS